MSREDIIRMAREANIKQAIETPHLLMVHELERFFQAAYAAGAAAEREACAQLCENMDWCYDDRKDFAAAIRARGNA